MRFLPHRLFLIVFLIAAGTVFGQDTPLLAPAAPGTIRTINPMDAPVSAGANNGSFKLVTGMLIASTIMDVETSFHALGNCASCREANPVLSPMLRGGRLKVYALQGAIDAGIILTSYQLKKGGHKYWWLAPIAISSAHFAFGGFNLRFTY